MKRINAAYDILMSPKLKQAYDEGLDPYDPEAKRAREFSDQVDGFFAKHDIKPEMPPEGPLQITLTVYVWNNRNA
jgi:curved DNA-binding protein CbpA